MCVCVSVCVCVCVRERENCEYVLSCHMVGDVAPQSLLQPPIDYPID